MTKGTQRILTVGALTLVVAAGTMWLLDFHDSVKAQLGRFRKDATFEERREAIANLARMGPNIVPKLNKALQDSDPDVRLGVIWTLQEMGSEAKAAVPALMKAVEDEDRQVRCAAVRTLGEIGSEAHAAIPVLFGLIEYPSSEDAAHEAFPAIRKISGKDAIVLKHLIDALKHPKPRIRAGAATAMRDAHFKDVDVLPLLIDALADAEATVREAAANSLSEHSGGKEAQAAVPSLAMLLKDSDSNVRRAAAATLFSIGPNAQKAIPQLIGILHDPYAGEIATRALGKIGPEARPAVPHLIEILKRQSGNARIYAGEALVGIGVVAVPAVAEVLKDSNVVVRRAAAQALSRMGWHLDKAIPTLAQAFRDQNRKVRPEAESSFSLLVEAFKDKDEEVCSHAALALAMIGAYDRRSVPALSAVLNDQKVFVDVRKGVIETLGAMGADASEAVPALTKALKDENYYVRDAAAKAMKNFRLDR